MAKSIYGMRFAAFGATLVALASAVAAEGPFALEQVMSSPFPTELTAAPAGGKVAWVFNARGVRNIWVAAPPDYQARQITAYTEDDGQEIAQLAWTPDTQEIVYARGGDFETHRSNPNPRSFPEGVEQDIWVISANGGQPRKLAEGNSPAVSPKGESVAYLSKDQVWLVSLHGTEKPAQLIHANGSSSALAWSPDGSKLVFQSSRGDHSLIALYDFTSKTLHFMDPSVDRDFDPVWSPDGRRIAFIRIPASRELLMFGPKRAAMPWSIHIAEVATGSGREVWKASEGTGSVFRGIVAENELMWGAGDRLVFPWERTGWVHLYSVSTEGGTAAELTPGQFEVEFVTLSSDRHETVFASNQDDIDRRHLWRVSVAGGPPSEMTSGAGIEWSPVITSDRKAIVFLASDARHPAHAAILAGSGPARDLAPETLPADFPLNALVEPQQVILPAADGLMIHAQLFLPPDIPPGVRRPAMLFFHGGSRRQMLLGWHYMEYYHNAYAMNQYLASRGYVVLSVNYRSGIGYGMEFREALNYGATGGSEFNDVMGAGVYLRSRRDVDPKRIGLWGGSYGGYLTAMALSRAPDLFSAGVDLHGVYDWNEVIHNFVPSYDPEKEREAARLAFASSPAASVKGWRAPVLLIQGDDDRNVPFDETVRLAEALRKQKVEVETLVFPDEVHDFLMHSSWLKAYHAAADFFDAHFGGFAGGK